MPNPTNWLERFEDGDRRNRNSGRLLFKGTDIEINNSDFTSTAKDSSQREKPTYICGLRARIECEPFSEHSTRSDRVTNIGYLLFLGAVFGFRACLKNTLRFYPNGSVCSSDK